MTNTKQTLIILLSLITLATIPMISLYKTEKLVSSLNRETQVHWLIPKRADCAIKMMYFRDSENNLIPESRMVCHWTHK